MNKYTPDQGDNVFSAKYMMLQLEATETLSANSKVKAELLNNSEAEKKGSMWNINITNISF